MFSKNSINSFGLVGRFLKNAFSSLFLLFRLAGNLLLLFSFSLAELIDCSEGGCFLPELFGWFGLVFGKVVCGGIGGLNFKPKFFAKLHCGHFGFSTLWHQGHTIL
ncbi:unnamed protein product [Rhizophagus irregularis]|nr:unnamed protein product [Rhizophagus irregularis]